MSKIRECIICGTKYEYCPNCKQYNQNEKWRMLYCSQNCMAIDKVRDKYKGGLLSQGEAKRELSKLAVPSIEAIADWARGTIAEILGDTTVAPIEESVVEAINEVPLENVLSASEIEEVLDSTEEVTEEPVQDEQEVDQVNEVVEETTSHKSRKRK